MLIKWDPVGFVGQYKVQHYWPTKWYSCSILRASGVEICCEPRVMDSYFSATYFLFMQGMVSNMKRLFCETQAINTNAQLTWRIESVSEKIEAAKSGTKPAIYSPPFFSNDAGNTHVFVCFVVGFYVHASIIRQ